MKPSKLPASKGGVYAEAIKGKVNFNRKGGEMRNEIALNRDSVFATDKLLKTTSLIYLKEALTNQQYEDCSRLVTSARGYGARQSEIRKVIAEYLVGAKAVRRARGTQKYGGRLGSY